MNAKTKSSAVAERWYNRTVGTRPIRQEHRCAIIDEIAVISGVKAQSNDNCIGVRWNVSMKNKPKNFTVAPDVMSKVMVTEMEMVLLVARFGKIYLLQMQ